MATLTDELKRIPADPTAPPVDLDRLRETVAELAERRAERRDLDVVIEGLENTLRSALGGATAGLVDGRLAVTWLPQSRCGIDTARVRADHGSAYDKYTTVRALRMRS